MNDVMINTSIGTIEVDCNWYGDNSPNSIDEGRWEYSVEVGDTVEVLYN